MERHHRAGVPRLLISIVLLLTSLTVGLVATSQAASAATVSPSAAELLSNGSFEAGAGACTAATPWYPRLTGSAICEYKQSGGVDGASFADFTTGTAGGSVLQDVNLSPAATTGSAYVGTIYVSSSTPISGTLELYAGNAQSGSNYGHAATAFTSGAAWQQVQVTLDVSGPATWLRLQVYNAGGTGHLHLDGATLRANLVKNGSFEAGTNGGCGSISPWQKTGTAQSCNYASAPNSHDGGAYDDTVDTDATGTIYEDVPVSGATVGTDYVATAYVRTPSGTVDGQLALFAGTSTGGSNSGAGYTAFRATTSWQLVQMTLMVSQATASSIRVQILDATGQSAHLSIDGVVLTQSTLTNGGFENRQTPATCGGIAPWSLRGNAPQQACSYISRPDSIDNAGYTDFVGADTSESILQDQQITSTPAGSDIVGSIWVRAPGGAVSGSLALFAGKEQVGSEAGTAITNFTATSTWQRIPVTLTTSAVAATWVRIQVYDNTGQSLHLSLDGGVLSAGANSGSNGTGSGSGTCFSSDHCWGFDRVGALDSSSYPAIVAQTGTPDFVGRYIDGAGSLPASEVSYLASKHVGITLYADLYGSCSSASNGSSEASTAVSNARALSIPPGVLISLDIEPSGAVTGDCLAAYADGITSAGYVAGFYENPSSSDPFAPAFCAEAPADANVANAVLYSQQKSYSLGTESNSPAFGNALTPNCSYGRTLFWQYAIWDTGPRSGNYNYDEDEITPAARQYLWYPS